MVRGGLTRGLVREKLNSDFMRLKKYKVIDDPIIKPSEALKLGLKLRKNPDHRINGKIFDSLAPKLEVTLQRWALGQLIVDKFDDVECLDDLPLWARKSWWNVQREYFKKKIENKVRAGGC